MVSAALVLLACTVPIPAGHDLPGGSTDHPADDSAPDGDDTADDSGTHPGDGTAEPLPTEVSPGFEGLAELGVRNIVFVHVDTLRADRLPMYGYTRDTLPKASARRYLLVSGLYAQSSWTIPSTMSVLSGQDIPTHGVAWIVDDGQLNATFAGTTIGLHLRDQGYETLFSTGNEGLAGRPSITSQFTSVNPELVGSPSTNLSWEVANMFAWMDLQQPNTRVLAFLQPMNVHGPYSPLPEHLGTWSDPDSLPFDVSGSEDTQHADFQHAWQAAGTPEAQAAVEEQVSAVYDETILGVDDALEELFDGLEARGILRQTLVVVSGDHGETLFEEPSNGVATFGHGGAIRQELVHVPLLFFNPAITTNSVDCLASNVDVMPTLLDALGAAPLPDADGRSLREGCRSIASSALWSNDTDQSVLTELAVTTGDASLRWVCADGAARHYDLTTDPLGVTDVPASALAQSEELELGMAGWVTELETTFGPANCTVE